MLDGWLPIRGIAAVKGEWGEECLVDVGAGIFLEMSVEEYNAHVSKVGEKGKAKVGPVTAPAWKDNADVVNPPEGEPFEIIEELTEMDRYLLESRGKPRIAHTLLYPSDPAMKTAPDQLSDLMKMVTVNQEQETGPLKSKVVERNPPPVTHDPAQTVMEAQVKASLFKRKTALTPTVRGDTPSLTLRPRD